VSTGIFSGLPGIIDTVTNAVGSVFKAKTNLESIKLQSRLALAKNERNFDLQLAALNQPPPVLSSFDPRSGAGSGSPSPIVVSGGGGVSTSTLMIGALLLGVLLLSRSG